MNSDEQYVDSDFCLLHSKPCEVTVHIQGKKNLKMQTPTPNTQNANTMLMQSI